jgi:hypothetical protein
VTLRSARCCSFDGKMKLNKRVWQCRAPDRRNRQKDFHFLLILAEDAMKRRRRIAQIEPLERRLTQEAQRLKELARQLPPGGDRTALLRKVRQTEAARDISEWLTAAHK